MNDSVPRKSRRVLILLINEVLDDPRVLKTARSLRDAGAEVTVACTNPAGRPRTETVGGMRVIRFPHRKDSLLKRCYLWFQGRVNPSLGRALTALREEPAPSPLRAAFRNLLLAANSRSFLRATRRVNRRMARAFTGERFDLVHANDVETLPAGCVLKRRGTAARLLYDSHEYWPGIGVVGSVANEAVRRMEAAGIRDADYVTTVNPLIADMLRRDYSLPEMPAVVMNCPLRDPVEPDTDAAHAPVRVLYQGKVQSFRGIERLVLAFHRIDGAVLTVSGDGPLLESIRALVAAEGLSGRVRITGRFEPDGALAIVREHDIGVLPFSPATVSITHSSPNKLFDYAMGGLAVVSADFPFLRRVVEENRMGLLIPDNEPETIAGAVRALVDDPAGLREFRMNARRAALESFSWEEQFAANYPWRG